ncbi:8-oxo-dGTP diphosphatase [Nocardioides albertanoniae]|uniref:8-oxo-dGTP diphosphatase n=1 Tax=Nocardioides albertanoniae TaxID=1175486 RepID=A0A543ABA1_9ACTN|nr:NUDIX domain-containing protein [Nocardioides albertanoniae]TQL69746.1 8-oxo-dGTP diphosphatase [Nocardioides albertanoniae]
MEHLPGQVTKVAVTVDLVVLTVRDDALCALVVRRAVEPHRGALALPGGFVLDQEDLEQAAARELAEETGMRPGSVHVEQLATYGAPGRDPRGRVVTVAYLALAPDLPVPAAGSDAAEAQWSPVASLLADNHPGSGIDSDIDRDAGLAFDHAEILRDGIERARAKLEYSPLGAAFCAEEFTVAELRRVYEIVWGERLDPRNFHRKVTKTEAFLEPTGATTTRDGGRPAQLFRRGSAEHLHPPLLRRAP